MSASNSFDEFVDVNFFRLKFYVLDHFVEGLSRSDDPNFLNASSSVISITLPRYP